MRPATNAILLVDRYLLDFFLMETLEDTLVQSPSERSSMGRDSGNGQPPVQLGRPRGVGLHPDRILTEQNLPLSVRLVLFPFGSFCPVRIARDDDCDVR